MQETATTNNITNQPATDAMIAANEVILKVQDMYKNYQVGIQEIPVLKGINLEVHRGDFAIILGASGSGKSTLLHGILGLERPSFGIVECLGVNLYTLVTEDERSDFRKKHIGMVYQQANWIKSLTVVENVAFPLALLGVDKSEAMTRAWQSLQNLNMQNWVGYIPTELSGGQQQKVALARALVTDPEVIIADEPTGNLDYESGQDLMQLLVKFNNLGKTVIMVTHDLEYVKYSKTAIRIRDGKVLEIVRNEDKAKLEEELKDKFKRGAQENEAQTAPATK